MISKTYHVPVISCGHCTATIERKLTPLTGVEKVEAHIERKQIIVTADTEDTFREVQKTLDDIGYPVSS